MLFTVFFGKVNAIVISERRRVLSAKQLVTLCPGVVIIRGHLRGRDVNREQIRTPKMTEKCKVSPEK